jgi:hypothetical protein
LLAVSDRLARGAKAGQMDDKDDETVELMMGVRL